MNGTHNQGWTEEDDNTLRGMYATEAMDIIAMELERTQQAVRQRAAILGLRRPANWDKFNQCVKP